MSSNLKVAGSISCVVDVDRTRTPQEVIDAISGASPRVQNDVVARMPGRGETVEKNVKVTFFYLGYEISDEELAEEFKRRNLVPADPYVLAAVNEADPGFADKYPNGTHWRDDQGNWCHMFLRDVGYINVNVVVIGHDPEHWGGNCWFAGLPK